MLKYEWIVGFKNCKTGVKVNFEYVCAIDSNEASLEAIKLLSNKDDWFCIMIEKRS